MGWLRKAPSGKWQARWRDPAGVERVRTFNYKDQARAFLAKIESAKVTGSYVDPKRGRLSLESYWPTFLEASPHLRPSTLALYESLWRTHVGPRLGLRALSTITRLDVDAFVARMSADGVGQATTNASYRLLRRVLSTAEAAGFIARNPARGVKAPTPPRAEMRFLTAEEIERIAHEVPDRYRALVLLLGFAGLRIGEATGLRLPNVELLRRRVLVTEAATEVGGRVIVGSPKTKDSIRSVALPSFVAEAIAEHLTAFPPGPDGYVFTADRNALIRRTNFRRRVWIPAVIAAKIDDPLPRVHDLRHSTAAIMIEAGAHPKLIQATLGHSSITVTLDRYGHLFEGLGEELAERLDAAARVRARAAPVRHAGLRSHRAKLQLAP